MEKDDLIKRWLKDELTASERKMFESAREFEDINKLSTALKHFKAPDYNTDTHYKQIQEQTFICSKNNVSWNVKKFIPHIAATIGILIIISYLSFIIQPFSNKQTNGWISRDSGIYLPDSSFVSLNKESKIRYSQKNWDQNRSVELQGEAYFKVNKGSRFTVITKQGIVSVLGTKFDVKDRPAYYEVTCFSGLVKVESTNSKNTVLLKPHKRFCIINKKEVSTTLVSNPKPDWLNGESSFTSIPFHQVIDEIERQYKVKITTKGIDEDFLFTGGFTHNNLEMALKAITIPVNLHYEIKNDKVVITVDTK